MAVAVKAHTQKGQINTGDRRVATALVITIAIEWKEGCELGVLAYR